MEYFIHLEADSVDAIKQACGTEVEALNVTENGTYTADSGKAYNPVTVNVESGGGDDPFETATVQVLYQPKDGDVTLVSISCVAVLFTDAKHVDFDGYKPQDMIELVKQFIEVQPTVQISLSDGDTLPVDISNFGLIAALSLHLSNDTTIFVNLEDASVSENITYNDGVLFVAGDGTIIVRA